MKLFLRFLVASASVLFLSISAYAGEVVLKFHSFPPMPANSNAKFVKPWSEKVLAESNGEIKVEIYPAMQLGGKPPQLVDQVRDGVVDIVWTVAGYTPGRFPHLEAFELPFMPASAEATWTTHHAAAWARNRRNGPRRGVDVEAPGLVGCCVL